MFLREEAHISPGSKRNTLYQLAAGCIKSMCRLGSNDEAQTLSDCLSLKKKLNYYQGHSISNDNNKNDRS
jgi:hypothetical protein